MPKTMLLQEPGNSRLQKLAAEGHRNRLGHELDMVLVSEDGIFWDTIRLCCGDKIPDEVSTLGPVPKTPSDQTVQRITALLFPSSPKGNP